MGIIINKNKHYFTRFLLGLFIIVLVSLSPFIIGFVGAYFVELRTGEPCNEANCYWAVFPWFGMLTLPIGAILLIVYIIIVVVDTLHLKNGQDKL